MSRNKDPKYSPAEDEQDLQLYIITELLDVRNLQTLINDRTEYFSIQSIVQMALDICSGKSFRKS